tara:strand:+ start:2836 stop:3381 length:546 start_codon:yes stop_codon:yes gene_type:complete
MTEYNDKEVEFQAWPKIPRSKGNLITVTEKIDGTNACVIIRDGEVVGFQSRNRLIKPGDDNMGFAFWGDLHKEELKNLGDGYHYGEWAGPGIQRNPHVLDNKTFFLFNTFRPQETLPSCVKQVQVLYHGTYSEEAIEECMSLLKAQAIEKGSVPEGVVTYLHDTRSYKKETFANREGKWNA